jgi:predicted esterase
MKIQAQGLAIALGGNAEFVFLNGPHKARGPPDLSVQRRYPKEKHLYEWYHLRTMKKEEIDPQFPEWYYQMIGLEESFSFFDKKLLELGPFDAVMGFSQGAVLSVMLTARYEAQCTRMWNVVIPVCGLRVRNPDLRHLFESPEGKCRPLQIPSIHLIGEQDDFVAHSYELVDQFDEAAGRFVFKHEEGHKFPSLDGYQTLYREMAEKILTICLNQTKS